MTLIERGSGGVHVVVMSVHLFLGGPAKLVVFAGLNWALPRSRMSFLVFGQITWTFEFLGASWLTAEWIPSKCKVPANQIHITSSIEVGRQVLLSLQVKTGSKFVWRRFRNIR
jgi:hypothetical protein